MDCARIVVGNWKMNKLPKEGSSFVEESVNLLLDVEKQIETARLLRDLQGKPMANILKNSYFLKHKR